MRTPGHVRRAFDTPDPDGPRSPSARHAGPARALAIVALALCVLAGFSGGDDGRDDVETSAVARAAMPAAVPGAAAPGTRAASATATATDGLVRRGADDAAATAVGAAAVDRVDAETQLTARRLMAHVEMARTALAADLVSAARQHVGEAIPLAERLVDEVAPGGRRATASLRAWIPMQDDERVVRTPASAGGVAADRPVVAADAHAVRTRRAVDAGSVLGQLRLAQQSLAAADAGAATRALDAAAGSVVAETDVRGLPLARVRDNLDLARRLAATGDDEAADDALDYARAALADAELADATLGRNADAIALRREIGQVAAELNARRPAAIEALRSALGRHAAALGTWLQAHLGY